MVWVLVSEGVIIPTSQLHVHRLEGVQTCMPCSHAKFCLLNVCIRPMHHATYLSGQVILSSLFTVQSKLKAATLIAPCPPSQNHVVGAVM